MTRIFSIAPNTVLSWLKKAANLPPLSATLLPPEPEDVLELEELWSFVLRRKNKPWVWLAQCR